jgi:hypothetical protein
LRDDLRYRECRRNLRRGGGDPSYGLCRRNVGKESSRTADDARRFVFSVTRGPKHQILLTNDDRHIARLTLWYLGIRKSIHGKAEQALIDSERGDRSTIGGILRKWSRGSDEHLPGIGSERGDCVVVRAVRARVDDGGRDRRIHDPRRRCRGWRCARWGPKVAGSGRRSQDGLTSGCPR